jgi:hypothetical protein
MGNDITTAKPNPYLPLVPEATAVLRQIMHTTLDEKVRAGIAKDILNGAGVTKDQGETSRPILIKDSQVQLLIQVAKEVS